ncbi:MAG: hypothetical protein AAGG55_02800 [Pseudomonadota bacterium]
MKSIVYLLNRALRPAGEFDAPVRTRLLVATLFVSLGACGDGESTDFGASTTSSCPPAQKGDGLMVGSRYDYEDLFEANRWRTEMFDASCAGDLAFMTPVLPSGWGVMPAPKPYVMNDEQIYLRIAELPTPLYNAEDQANVPPTLNNVGLEVVKFAPDELDKLRSWMAENEGAYLASKVDGHPVYLMGGGATGRPGKGDRLSVGLVAVFDSGLIVKVSHKNLYSQMGGLEINGITRSVMSDLIAKAEAEGHRPL